MSAEKKHAEELMNLMHTIRDLPGHGTTLLDKMRAEASSAELGDFLDREARKVIAIGIPKAMMVLAKGSVMKVAKAVTVEKAYMDSMEMCKKDLPAVYKRISATIRLGGEEIAQAIDTTIRRVVLDDTEINREAYLDILHAHASLLRAFVGLTELPKSDGSDV